MPYQSSCKCGHSHVIFKLGKILKAKKSNKKELKFFIDAVLTSTKRCNGWKCKCKGYVPSDNLEYLAWKYEKHKLKIK